jgi:diamine N-acetyltransferase
MTDVHLRPITLANYRECIALQLDPTQVGFVASNAHSLAEAKVNSTLTPLAIYAAAACGHDDPPVPMRGFAMYEIAADVGFIMRLMIDRAHQGQGYGRAATIEIIRRLRLSPDVEVIATGHHHENVGAGRLYRSLGFLLWEPTWATPDSHDVYLTLPD